ncbi:glycosyltransferase family 4 protein [Pseudomonas sp. CCI3.2]|uniref:MraY family glycosyltransferase n=1 Tax=unclassified Pseudomonas TaxID=196821 RepID=UPI002AC92A60|nr:MULTISPECIES: glycosyltransferase family 4 protein [unclassified Pseudomonas]MEB0075960.1 glycosyltransferase family 4 protein [Pseudomonas sp. MH10out]MEB0101405.1 glycosyltransferase family 4 protein [Pseudomonas sp. CCI3.2]MEB0130939.1 glycosyltransferase family 4 protein [Pseudomonas sp. CCI2.4]MEB0157917.1 glycosyltransferase family 4 protein [Pseudomonas sp. AH2 (2023)]MEB0166378.1 glycosyltransferase family 4 protein [Pseudomonas sp. CCC4.4]
MSYWWLTPAIAFLSFFLTSVLRRYALARSLLDIPNARSSHSLPTPRGGGVAIVIVFLCALSYLLWSGAITSIVFTGMAGAGLIVSVVGFIDDHQHVAARWRLLGHFFAAGWVLVWIGKFPTLHLFGLSVDFGWSGYVLAALYLVWMLNLYNFMDGIDGIAGVQAVSVCIGACWVYWLKGDTALLAPPLLLAACVLGFLLWNFPTAKIFMGDVGSSFLGMALAALSIQSAWVRSEYFWAWIILMGVFIVDATFTLVRRLARGEKAYEAHRSHAYQFASRHYRRHPPVTIAVGLINLFWLLPLATAVACFGLDGAMGILLAYTPLVILAWKFHAGARENQHAI